MCCIKTADKHLDCSHLPSFSPFSLSHYFSPSLFIFLTFFLILGHLCITSHSVTSIIFTFEGHHHSLLHLLYIFLFIIFDLYITSTVSELSHSQIANKNKKRKYFLNLLRSLVYRQGFLSNMVLCSGLLFKVKIPQRFLA